MRILICDDEPAMVSRISGIIEDAYPDIELVGVHSSAELSERLAPEDADKNFDLAFVDISVKDESLFLYQSRRLVTIYILPPVSSARKPSSIKPFATEKSV